MALIENMNYSTAIFLFRADVRAIDCTYEDDEDAPRYTYKSMNPNIKVDDYVLIPTKTRHCMTVAKVAAVDIAHDPDWDFDMQWIIGVVDTREHESILDQEKRAITKIKGAEKRRQREGLAEALRADVGEDLQSIPLFMTEDEAKATNGEAS
jgi:hypothetical protein